jgi:hypothetical protein
MVSTYRLLILLILLSGCLACYSQNPFLVAERLLLGSYDDSIQLYTFCSYSTDNQCFEFREGSTPNVLEVSKSLGSEWYILNSGNVHIQRLNGRYALSVNNSDPHTLNHLNQGWSSLHYSRYYHVILNTIDGGAPGKQISPRITYYDINNKTINKLSVNGYAVKAINNTIYFSEYANPKQFDAVFNIYHIDSLTDSVPKLDFRYHYDWGLEISPDGRYLLASVINTGYIPKWIIFDLQTKRFAYLPEFDRFQKSNFRRIWLSRNQGILFYQATIKPGEIRQTKYVPIPAAEEFKYTPEWAMEFADSFINAWWLDEAPLDSLITLSQRDLRLLRNAVFARKGWRFQSDDLNEFFQQFDWYYVQKNQWLNNEDINLTNNDKYRIKLIREAEETKK